MFNIKNYLTNKLSLRTSNVSEVLSNVGEKSSSQDNIVEGEGFICPVCKLIFPDTVELQFHYEIHLNHIDVADKNLRDSYFENKYLENDFFNMQPSPPIEPICLSHKNNEIKAEQEVEIKTNSESEIIILDYKLQKLENENEEGLLNSILNKQNFILFNEQKLPYFQHYQQKIITIRENNFCQLPDIHEEVFKMSEKEFTLIHENVGQDNLRLHDFFMKEKKIEKSDVKGGTQQIIEPYNLIPDKELKCVLYNLSEFPRNDVKENGYHISNFSAQDIDQKCTNLQSEYNLLQKIFLNLETEYEINSIPENDIKKQLMFQTNINKNLLREIKTIQISYQNNLKYIKEKRNLDAEKIKEENKKLLTEFLNIGTQCSSIKKDCKLLKCVCEKWVSHMSNIKSEILTLCANYIDKYENHRYHDIYTLKYENEKHVNNILILEQEISKSQDKLHQELITKENLENKIACMEIDFKIFQNQLETETDNFQKTKDDLLRTNAQLSKDLHNMKVELNSKLLKIKELTTELDQKTDLLLEKETKYNEVINKFKNVEDSDLEKSRIIKNFELQLKEQLEHITLLNENINRITSDKNKLQSIVDNGENEKQILLNSLLNQKAELEQQSNILIEVKRKLEDTQAALNELGWENQSLQMEVAKISDRKWSDDSNIANCRRCHKEFTLTIRKHHCRNCGEVFCHECSSRNVPLPSCKKPVRVCDKCFKHLYKAYN